MSMCLRGVNAALFPRTLRDLMREAEPFIREKPTLSTLSALQVAWLPEIVTLDELVVRPTDE